MYTHMYMWVHGKIKVISKKQQLKNRNDLNACVNS